MTWLIVCRAVQGIGGGGIQQLVQITISDIVSLEEYAPFLLISMSDDRRELFADCLISTFVALVDF